MNEFIVEYDSITHKMTCFEEFYLRTKERHCHTTVLNIPYSFNVCHMEFVIENKQTGATQLCHPRHFPSQENEHTPPRPNSHSNPNNTINLFTFKPYLNKANDFIAL
ncbi:hypothetical protein CEXT_68351 [Caerostris extrusa]|uniref:Uncharacterized protein n=1 Tax=Caerostris extrusa TaxID=172846 RepID=A0AAV4T913_CAEEX|nr:hypothetical protein CEXT_68351 [Caerostris extrusa]